MTWTGASGTDWSNTANWSGTGANPPGPGDTALINIPLSSITNSVSNQSPGSISFDSSAGTASGTLTIGATGGNSLTLANAGTVQILSTLSGSGENITIDAPIVLTPASATTAGTYTFSNNSTDSTDTLNFGGAISGE